MNDETIVVIALFWLSCAVFSAMVASSKNRDGAGWFFIGLLFGIVGLIAASGMSSLVEPTVAQQPLARSTGKRISMTGEPIPPGKQTKAKSPDKRCQYCGTQFFMAEARWERGGLIVCYDCSQKQDFFVE